MSLDTDVFLCVGFRQSGPGAVKHDMTEVGREVQARRKLRTEAKSHLSSSSSSHALATDLALGRSASRFDVLPSVCAAHVFCWLDARNHVVLARACTWLCAVSRLRAASLHAVRWADFRSVPAALESARPFYLDTRVSNLSWVPIYGASLRHLALDTTWVGRTRTISFHSMTRLTSLTTLDQSGPLWCGDDYERLWTHIFALPALTSLRTQCMSSLAVARLNEVRQLRRLTFDAGLPYDMCKCAIEMPRLDRLSELVFCGFGSGKSGMSVATLHNMLCKLPQLRVLAGVITTPYSGSDTLSLPPMPSRPLPAPLLERCDVTGQLGLRHLLETCSALTHVVARPHLYETLDQLYAVHPARNSSRGTAATHKKRMQDAHVAEMGVTTDNPTPETPGDSRAPFVFELIGFSDHVLGLSDARFFGHLELAARLRADRVVFRHCTIVDSLAAIMSAAELAPKHVTLDGCYLNDDVTAHNAVAYKSFEAASEKWPLRSLRLENCRHMRRVAPPSPTTVTDIDATNANPWIDIPPALLTNLGGDYWWRPLAPSLLLRHMPFVDRLEYAGACAFENVPSSSHAFQTWLCSDICLVATLLAPRPSILSLSGMTFLGDLARLTIRQHVTRLGHEFGGRLTLVE